jgi:beta-lactamase regulating signal transducer with metallopeptidase domain/ABC-type glycerol-3-phosphate transport system substrate-binding protein
LENSAVMSVAILVMYGLSRLTRNKASARVRYACWIVIVVGLLLPVRPALFTVRLPEGVAEAVAEVVTQTSRMAEADVPEGVTVINSTPAEGYAEKCPEYEFAAVLTVPASTGVSAGVSIEAEIPVRAVNWQALLPVVWGAGAVLFLLWCILRHIAFMKKIRRWAYPCTDGYTINQLEKVCLQLGLRRLPRLSVCPLTATPIVTGLFRPLLILPDEAVEPDKLKLIFLHEVMHIKRGDNFVRLLSVVAIAAHWFNPLVYLMNRAVHTEAELACDADVLRHAGDGARFEYGQTIFNTAQRVQRLRSMLASAMSGEGKSLKRRLANIIEKKHTRRGLAVFCAALMIGGVLLAGMLSYGGANEPDGGFTEDIGWQGDGAVLDPDRYAAEALDLSEINPNEAVDTVEAPPPPPVHINDPITLEHTDRLVIYVPGGDDFYHSRIIAAANTFRFRYPDIELVVERVGTEADFREAYIQRVSTEIMAGMGPDIILTHFFDDIHKTMESGAFLNLSPLWHRDADFDAREHMNPIIMDTGLYRGRRYVIPISFNFPLLLGERGMLEGVGFDPDAELDTASFLNAITAVVPKARENPLFHFPLFMINAYQTGIPLADFERGIPLPYEQAIRDFSEAYRPFAGWWEQDWSESFWRRETPTTWLSLGRMLFDNNSNMSVQIFFDISLMKLREHEPVVTAFRNHHGELHATIVQSVAVNANSPNYANAWKFIRLLLSDSRQFGQLGGMEAWGLGGGMPVNTEALSRQITTVVATSGLVGTSEGSITHPALTMEEKQPVIDLINGITSASLPNHTVTGFYYEAMEPFFAGERSLDEAMEELQRRIRLYLSE